MPNPPTPSAYDQGEDNWSSKKMSFDDWVRMDKPSRLVSDKRMTDSKRRKLYEDRGNFEPEFV
jgi:hypothetical protein